MILLTPTSRKAKSRIGRHPILAKVEQDVDDKLFVVINDSHCRWVSKVNDPDFLVEEVLSQ
jgi:hypothetical protein